jgi:hypothetical protein
MADPSPVAVGLVTGVDSPTIPPPVLTPPAAAVRTMEPVAVAVLAPPAPAPPRAIATNALSPDIVAALLRRADTVLRQGDVLTARLFYERAAAAGSGEGATGAGKTYDPNFIATIDAPGLRGDVARAIAWYRMGAVALGDREAGERLKVLTGP